MNFFVSLQDSMISRWSWDDRMNLSRIGELKIEIMQTWGFGQTVRHPKISSIHNPNIPIVDVVCLKMCQSVCLIYFTRWVALCRRSIRRSTRRCIRRPTRRPTWGPILWPVYWQPCPLLFDPTPIFKIYDRRQPWIPSQGKWSYFSARWSAAGMHWGSSIGPGPQPWGLIFTPLRLLKLQYKLCSDVVCARWERLVKA